MLNQEKGNSNGERTAIGIDPCKEFLMVAEQLDLDALGVVLSFRVVTG